MAPYFLAFRLVSSQLERVGVGEFALGDVGVRPLDQQARVLAFEQRAGDSAGPEVDAGACVLGDLGVNHHVGELQTPAWAQDAVDLVEPRVLVGHQVDDAIVGDARELGLG